MLAWQVQICKNKDIFQRWQTFGTHAQSGMRDDFQVARHILEIYQK